MGDVAGMSRNHEGETGRSDRAGRSGLHYAAMNDDTQSIRALVDSGSDVNGQDRRGMTPLHFAAQERAVAAAQLLLELGAAVDVRDAHGNTPLSTAVYSARSEGGIVPLLLERGANPLLENLYGVSPLSLSRTIASSDVRKYFEHL